jgi:hypothetical protein
MKRNYHIRPYFDILDDGTSSEGIEVYDNSGKLLRTLGRNEYPEDLEDMDDDEVEEFLDKLCY